MGLISDKLYRHLRRNPPRMSSTEREAISAGGTWIDRDIFSGSIPWHGLNNGLVSINLAKEEQEFLDGPVQELCEMLDDDQINRNADLPIHVWTFLKDNRFFGMNIDKDYGGLGFSARAQSEVVMKISSRSVAAAVTVMVPNSLGPGELIQKYGTEEEKEKYLFNLSHGKEIPCFGLTGPEAGSDATSTPDYGYVVEINGKLHLKLTFNKRYITLAPVSTIIGLAVNIFDHKGLLGGEEDLGLTVVLLPSNTAGVEIERHNPLDIGFMNGPVRGRDVLVPIESVLGGRDNIGRGWKMLVECLSDGRGISLPALATGAGKLASDKTGAYSRVRKQFKLPIGKFEGIEEPLARIGGFTHIMDSVRKLTLFAIDCQHRPSVLTAISKYHLTEMSRQVVNDAMDIQGGSGIILGPNNYIGKLYQSIPIAITVEGANILTRSMIIFGQGAMKSHPYLHDEIRYANDEMPGSFTETVNAHVSMAIDNARTTVLKGLGSGFRKKKNYKADLDRMTAAFSFTADIMLALYGPSLKRRERISARLGDILSYIYMAISVQRRSEMFHEGKVPEYLHDWCMQYLLFKIQESFHSLFDNSEWKKTSRILRRMIFPYGRCFSMPSDDLDHKVANMLIDPENEFRNTLINGVFTSTDMNDKTNKLRRAFSSSVTYDSLVKRVSKYPGKTLQERAENALDDGTISEDEIYFIVMQNALRSEVIQVDSSKK